MAWRLRPEPVKTLLQAYFYGCYIFSCSQAPIYTFIVNLVNFKFNLISFNINTQPQSATHDELFIKQQSVSMEKATLKLPKVANFACNVNVIAYNRPNKTQTCKFPELLQHRPNYYKLDNLYDILCIGLYFTNDVKVAACLSNSL